MYFLLMAGEKLVYFTMFIPSPKEPYVPSYFQMLEYAGL
jgi:hypothetical protein